MNVSDSVSVSASTNRKPSLQPLFSASATLHPINLRISQLFPDDTVTHFLCGSLLFHLSRDLSTSHSSWAENSEGTAAQRKDKTRNSYRAETVAAPHTNATDNNSDTTTQPFLWPTRPDTRVTHKPHLPSRTHTHTRPLTEQPRPAVDLYICLFSLLLCEDGGDETCWCIAAISGCNYLPFPKLTDGTNGTRGGQKSQSPPTATGTRGIISFYYPCQFVQHYYQLNEWLPNAAWRTTMTAAD